MLLDKPTEFIKYTFLLTLSLEEFSAKSAN